MAKLPAAQTISVKASSGTPAFTAATPGTDEWLTVDPSSGNLPATLNVRVNPTSLPASTYNSTVTITVTGIPVLTIPVTLAFERRHSACVRRRVRELRRISR